MRRASQVYVLSALALAIAGPADAAFFRADTATASSTLPALGAFGAVNTINGSGLPANFDSSSSHDIYRNTNGGNHWTNDGISPLTEWIEWGFTADQTVGTIYVWNHRANRAVDEIAEVGNSGYEPTVFDLTLRDQNGVQVGFLDNLRLRPDVAVGQAVSLGSTFSNVRAIRFDIEATQSSTTWTGLAEVAFDSSIVPLPAAGLLFGTALVGLATIYRRRIAGARPVGVAERGRN